MSQRLPFLGHGVGLRVPHYPRALEGGIDVDWVEVISENFLGGGGRPRAVLERLRRDLPLVFHGVSLGIGSAGPPLARYLTQLRELVDTYDPAWVSDHLCWGHLDEVFSHDLLPLPYTEEALAHVVENVLRVQDALRRPLLLENVSSYVSYQGSQLPEWEFLAEVARRSGCLLLVDLNNILVSAFNHGFRPERYLAGLPAERIQQLHLANHTQLPTHRFDDHRGPVPEAVWQLFEAAWRSFGPVSSLVEWDEDVPAWEELRAEQRQAASRAQRVLAEGGGARSLVAAPSVPAAPSVRSAAAPLRETQALFFEAVRHPTGVAHWLEHSGSEHGSEKDGREERSRAERRARFAATFAGSPSFSALQRLDVYANSYFYRLLDALRELFPRLRFLCGETDFHNLVTDYVLSCPSREPDLRRLGGRLPAFLGSHELARRAPLLVAVAELEQALNVALDAPEGALLTADHLGAIAPERWPELRFRFSAPTTCLATHWELERLESLYAAGQREAALELAAQSPPSVLLVGRRGYATYFRRVPAAGGALLHQLWQGASFGDACAALERAGVGYEPAELVQALTRWLADGLLLAPESQGHAAPGAPGAGGR